MHISELADRFVKDPREVVKVGDVVTVRVKEVDAERKRIAFDHALGAIEKSGGDRPREPQRSSGPVSAARSSAAPPQRKGELEAESALAAALRRAREEGRPGVADGKQAQQGGAEKHPMPKPRPRSSCARLAS